MRLFIAEKPELGRAIAEVLGIVSKERGFIRCGNNDIVTWCFGHLLTLSDPEDHDPSAKKWSMDSLPLVWPVEHKPIADKVDQIELIRNLASKATLLVNSADPDEQGQYLVDELIDYIGNTKPVKRLLINDLNKKIVQRALDNMQDNADFFTLYQSAMAMAVSDQHYGYNLTRAYTLAGRAAGAEQVLSVGRVQTPILGLVVRRDMAHSSHSAQSYIDISATFTASEVTLIAKHLPGEDVEVDDKGRITDANYAAELVASVKGKQASVKDTTTKDKSENPPLPYNLLNLQADASRKFGFSPDKTLKLTQSLRENHKLITYNRSDCQYLSDVQHEDAPAVMNAISSSAPVLSSAVAAGDTSIKSRAFNSANVTAHHAIVPTETSKDLSLINDDESKLYLLIARAYVAQFWPKFEYKETVLNLDVCGYAFRATSRVTTNEGWKRLYRADKDNEEIQTQDAENTASIAWVNSQSELTCQSAESETKKTKPPALYTMASLLKDLTRVAKYVTDPAIKKLLLEKDKDKKAESGGIGTPATRSAIIEQLLRRGFIAEEKKKVISTTLGREFYELLPDSATAPDMTALWHQQQEQIKSGAMSLEEFVSSVDAHISSEVSRIKSDGIQVSEAVAVTGPKCQKCDSGVLKRRKGKSGFFLGLQRIPRL